MTGSNGLDTWERQSPYSDGISISVGNGIMENAGILKNNTLSPQDLKHCVCVCIHSVGLSVKCRSVCVCVINVQEEVVTIVFSCLY